MIILKGKVRHTTHSYTKLSEKKKVEKERQQRKLSVPVVSKTVCSALWAPVWSKDYGGTAPPGPSPRSATVIYKVGR